MTDDFKKYQKTQFPTRNWQCKNASGNKKFMDVVVVGNCH